MEKTPSKKDLQKIIEDLLGQPYSVVEGDEEYQQGFGEEGGRKAHYIIDDLRYRETEGDVRISELGYLSVGGADGSEIAWVLKETDISKGVIVELSDSGAQRARERAIELSKLGKELVVIQGDAMERLNDALESLEKWLARGEISGLVCSAQAVLHELPRRSPTFDLSVFLGKLFRDERWNARAFYSREPGRPEGWTENVRIAIPGVKGGILARFAMYTRDRLSMKGNPEAFVGDWVGLPSLLAVETLHKLIRGNSLKRIGYELGEQLTEFEPIDVKVQLESLIDGMRVSVDRITTRGFKRALEQYAVRYAGDKSEPLPVPRTHAEIIGFVRAHPPIARMSPPATRLDLPTSITEAEVEQLFGDDLKTADVDAWLGQFEPEERVYVAALLRGFKYYGKRRITDLCRELYLLVMKQLDDHDPNSVRFVPFGGAGKSGALVAYYFRIANNLNSASFVEMAALQQKTDMDATPLVFLDDILASGRQAATIWHSLVSEGKLKTTTRALLATLVGTSAGARYLEERTTLTTCAADLAHNPFDSHSRLFASVRDMEIARAIAESYGRKLVSHAPLGFLGGGMLVGFSHGTPDNTLPIFWSKQNGWRPLLDAGGSDRLKLGSYRKPEM